MTHIRTAVALLGTLLLVGCSPSIPDPHDESVEAERVAATRDVERFGPGAWGLGRPLGQAERDVCQTGQRNWKVEEVHFACAVGRVWILPGAHARDDVLPAIDTMTSRLEELGCEPASEFELNQARDRWTRDEYYVAGNLPGGRYRCDEVLVEVDFIGEGQPGDPPPMLHPLQMIGSLTGREEEVVTQQEFAPGLLERLLARQDQFVWQIVSSRDYAVVE